MEIMKSKEKLKAEEIGLKELEKAVQTAKDWKNKLYFAIVSVLFFTFSSVMCFINPDISNIFGYVCLPAVLVFGVLIIRSHNYLKKELEYIPMVESLNRQFDELEF